MIKKQQIKQKNTRQESQGCKKTIQVIIMLSLFLIFFSNFVSALMSTEFTKDTQKSLNKATDYGTVTLNNRNFLDIFGWFETPKEAITLVENTEVCYSDCYAIKEITLYSKGKLVDSVKFETIKEDGSRVEQSIRNYKFYIQDGTKEVTYDIHTPTSTGKILVNGSQEVKDLVTRGTRQELIWKPYNYEELEAGDYVLKLVGEKKEDRSVDWIITSQGQEIRNWAVWTGSTGEYYHNIPFSLLTSVSNPYGMKINATSSVEIQGFWINGTTANWCSYRNDSGFALSNGTITNYFCNAQYNLSSGNHITLQVFNVSGGGGYGLFGNDTLGTPYPIITGSIQWVEGNQLTTFYTNFAYAITGIKIVEQGAISLLSPANNYSSVNLLQKFNASAVHSVNITNASLWTNESGVFSLEEILTGFTGVNGTANINHTFSSTGSYLWNIEFCDTDGDCGFSIANRTINIKNFIENSQSYNNLTTEGSTEIFTINATISSGLQLSSANLIYDSINYGGIFTNLNNKIIAQKTIIIPSVTLAENNSFYWKFTFSDSSQINSTTNIQAVNNLNIDNCSAYSNLLYNFTLKDEETKNKIIKATTIELSLNLYDASRTKNILNFSKQYNNTNPARICLEKAIFVGINYSSDVTVKYYANVTLTNSSSSDYAVEYYHIVNQIVSNSTIPQSINLYDLLLEDTTDFQLTFRDSSLALAQNVLVYVYRQYVEDNDFKIVEIPQTDSNGQTVLHLVRNNVVYNFVMVDENRNIIATFNKIIAFCQDYTIGSCAIKLNAPSGGDTFYNYDEDLGMSYTNPVYSNVTGLVSFSFISNNLSTLNVQEEVIRNNQFGNRSVCVSTLTSSTGTISCNVSSITNTDRFLFVNIYVNGDLKVTYPIDLEHDTSGFGIVNGAFYAFLLILTIIIMFMEDKKALIVALGVGWIVVISFSLMKGSILGTSAGTVWLLISIIIFLYKLTKEDKYQ